MGQHNSSINGGMNVTTQYSTWAGPLSSGPLYERIDLGRAWAYLILQGHA